MNKIKKLIIAAWVKNIDASILSSTLEGERSNFLVLENNVKRL
ncbi:hypothetical protein [Bacillus cereus]